ncbi:LysR family transcriptional regulator [Lichenicola cladoniae]|uniref:LysR family transcriptional regulator n=1 Tax=Lichenicola cladoniae TaxID=1484109 RepID=A0A6M8HP27_9PROT|nr:LysR family transcriptional regulator [Lichenicola cladoniae]NPD66583.1 LysR family transcriptional regulator [Acetobacteraceae bacterium]QKE90209.1 LysR family transcriptional regulator [Lichenicola cladoniae]
MRGGEFAELAAFVQVARERSFRRASQQLGLSPSTLSRTIRSLEERLGTRLLNRTTRSVAPTEAGDVLLKRMHGAMAEMDGAVREAAAHQVRPRGLVRLNLPHVAARVVIAPILAGFSQAYPDIRLDLVLDDGMTDVVGAGFDAGIRSGALVQRDMVAVPLTPDLRMAVVGSPAYFASRQLPSLPEHIRNHACITYRWHGTGALFRWSFDGPDGHVDVAVDSVVTANDTDLLLTAALAGVGLAFLPECMVTEHIRRGVLVRVLEDWCQPFSGFHLYYPSRPYMPPALQAFVDFVRRPEAQIPAGA